ncbi:MAG: DUF5615 family PIN-like protein [Deltaproteobacteria bacterium]|nr:DUF5615 family PIN-like protein [Deltaproteobacteria bacterium]MBW1960448.1 DUF5615 family PIN-like protein [Deltaproteobacteria bacterium]MBW1993406.1 DUF5615 family PIN-like protein [Deltaproteobacteria bacterium]MBW2151433.1 DUF5615 family PIN-like protein [Deltaproteobacteria bacterium]
MDQHIPRAITEGLRLRGVDVITAYEDGADKMGDAELLDRATKLGRVLFTQDNDLLSECARRQKEGIPFSGVIYAHQMRVSIGACIHDLEIISKAGEVEDLSNRIQFLPL